MTLIFEHKITQTKNPNTKTTYIVEKDCTNLITEEQYRNITNEDTIKWFRRIGGTESVTKSYTNYGYVPTRIVSTSPNKQDRTLRDFVFCYLSYNEAIEYSKIFKEYKDGLFYLKRFKKGKTFIELKEILKNRLEQ